ncbi:MAG: hypothetical protein K5898_00360 [Ruminococcus sp.]|uniref:hypothetical protein n=1 Tax=Ruminococcus sp. TaxID=41978 RepID=UPI002600C1D5|nr:hypothetical protein [Ruminococcus sp.]MCR4793638.1 hypothetical protein [Ruminococcus sp.]
MKKLNIVAKTGIAIEIAALIVMLVFLISGGPVPKWAVLLLFAGAIICFISGFLPEKAINPDMRSKTNPKAFG